MLESLLVILVAALVLWVIFMLVGKFMDGTPLQIVGIILGIVLLLIAARQFGVGPNYLR